MTPGKRMKAGSKKDDGRKKDRTLTMKEVSIGFAGVGVPHEPCEGAPYGIEHWLDVPAHKHHSHTAQEPATSAGHQQKKVQPDSVADCMHYATHACTNLQKSHIPVAHASGMTQICKGRWPQRQRAEQSTPIGVTAGASVPGKGWANRCNRAQGV